ncbi:MAG TPA: type II toxin-antitoxin system VapC family toxin [Solirubrobacteraceae bacterium]|nr:type II toxin-antitoxin system VapC family toxin [Solirubrobacteraceae bacterium]
MNALVDTSVLVDYLRGVEPARELLRSAFEREEVVAASVLTRIELSIGMRPSERRATDALAGALRWLAVDTSVAKQADALARRYARGHSGIDAVDYCVAASALVNGLELWTLNVRHFPMFEGLRPPW